MPFHIPESAKKVSRSGQPLSKNTIAQYKAILNKLANQGWDNIDKLLQYQTDVVKYINSLSDSDNDAARFQKRKFLSAVFFVLDASPLEVKREYYDAFQKSKQNYSSSL